MFKNMTLDELKAELEKRTEFRFEKKSFLRRRKILSLKGLWKQARIEIDFDCLGRDKLIYVKIKGKRRNKGNKRKKTSGFFTWASDIDEIINNLNIFASCYGWKPSNEQTSFLKEK